MTPAPVLFAVERLAPCGATDVVRELARRLDRRRFAPRVVALHAGPGPGDPELERTGAERLLRDDVSAETLELPVETGFAGRTARLSRWLRGQQLAVVHAHSRPADLWLTWAAAAARVPVRLYSRQATYGGLPPLTRARYAVTSRLATRVIAVSDAVREHLRRREGVPRARIELIRDGIDLARLAPPADPAAVRARLGLPARAPLVGCVADLVPRKGQRFLVEAAARVLRRFPEARFVLVGEGPERGALEARIRALGLSAAFCLPGFRDDALELIGALDVFVLPSLWEGLNLSLLSACALGRAVVATHLLSNREIVEPGVSGLLPDPASPVLEARALAPDALAAAIESLLADPAVRGRLGERARQRTVARFGADAMAARHGELYERLLREARR